MSDIQYKNNRAPLQVCEVSGHPNYTKMNWEQFNKKLDEYLIRRGMVSASPYKVRGIAARHKKGAENKECSQENQENNFRKKSKKKA